MKNWNDAGTVHYDSSTAQQYGEVRLDFEHVSRRWRFVLAIPLTIRRSLKSTDYDQALEIAKRSLQTSIPGGASDQRAAISAKIAMIEFLYTCFTRNQAEAGNQVWQTPGSMQEIGPDPIDDITDLKEGGYI